MPGTFMIDPAQTFMVSLLMASAPKLKFQSTEQEISAGGHPKWAVEAAVTFFAQHGMKPISEVISVTIESPNDPSQGIPPGTPIVFEGFRLGISSPEKNDKGGIRGGKPWYQSAGIRPMHAQQRAGKAEG